MGTIANVSRNALKPSMLREMTRKATRRVTGAGRDDSAEARAWCEANVVDLGGWATELDAALWNEAVEFSRTMRAEAEVRGAELEAQGVQLGGAGCYELLYFLARHLRPVNTLETGVAAGWSTWALLAALQRNGSGTLYSSDLPYFRIANPEKYVAYLVPEDLRDPGRWQLHIKGDEKNLKSILAPGRTFDLVHYDSDKTWEGREFFVDRVTPYLAGGAWLVMDDINDNLFFRDLVVGRESVVFRFAGKHIGVLPGQRPASTTE